MFIQSRLSSSITLVVGFLLVGAVVILLAPAADAATNISACGVLSTANETYLLTQDVTATGTCFTIAAHGITLDLQEHTIYYGTGSATRMYGVAIPSSSVTRRPWFPDPSIPNSAFVGADNVTIQNGMIVQFGDGTESYPIYIWGSDNTTITGTLTQSNGDDTGNIYFNYSSGATVSDNYLINFSSVVTNRHQGRDVIGFEGGNGNLRIHNNYIWGGPQYGIRVRQGSATQPVYIYDNYISNDGIVANPYAIGVSVNNARVYGNTITPNNGRGIHLAGVTGAQVYNNTISVSEGANLEYSPGWTQGIKVENSYYASIHDNEIWATAGNGFGHAYALDITHDPSSGAPSNSEIFDNTFVAITWDNDRTAAAIHLTGVNPSSGFDIHHNDIQGNNYLVFADYDSASDVHFRSNSFSQMGEATNLKFLYFYTGSKPSQDLYFLDSTYDVWINPTNAGYRAAGADVSYHIQQYISLAVTNESAVPLAGASVSIRDNAGTVVGSGTTDSEGQALFAVKTNSYVGKPFVSTAFTPHTVYVSKTGFKSIAYPVTLSSSQAVIVALASITGGGQSSADQELFDDTADPVPSPLPAPGTSVNPTPMAWSPRLTESTASFFAYRSDERKGYQVAAGNVLRDYREEIIVGTTSGMAPHVRVFDNAGNVRSQFFPYDPGLRNGVTVTACNVMGNSLEEIVTAQDRGGWPLIRIFNGFGERLHEGFFVFDGKFTGGINLACGDINGDGLHEIIVAARRGGGPQVMVYSGTGRIIANFMAYDKGFRGGISVAAADTDDDGIDEIITGPQWGAPHIQIFNVSSGTGRRDSPGFFAFNRDYRGGVSVAGLDTNGDGTKEIVVGVGDNATPFVKVYSGRQEWRDEFFAYGTSFLGGVQLAGGDVDGDGADELITIPRGRGAPQVRVIDLD
ncbi:MAG: right-handed parallel beta-helix repeat-containing protein [Candidatus Kerfeldbacteria bacterium]|nr:right-handed parallel beta-helix repeat-containing protein [Candidatus Kerfeldbacteria bacterium]